MQTNTIHDTSLLEDAMKKYDISYNDEMLDNYIRYYDLLIKVNENMNLTAITDWDEVQLKHFSDSLSLSAYLNGKLKRESQISDFKSVNDSPYGSSLFNDRIKVLDLGTGAGFPGIPLKIANPDLKITLADSLNKRIRFLDEVISVLNLKNINTVHGRAEEMARQKEMREGFDLVISRAVANASTLSEYCLPFVKVGGYFISYKTESVDEEADQAGKAIKTLGGKIVDIFHFTLPGSDMQRSFLVIKKIKATPKAYPRKAGTPSRNPIS